MDFQKIASRTESKYINDSTSCYCVESKKCTVPRCIAIQVHCREYTRETASHAQMRLMHRKEDSSLTGLKPIRFRRVRVSILRIISCHLPIVMIPLSRTKIFGARKSRYICVKLCVRLCGFIQDSVCFIPLLMKPSLSRVEFRPRIRYFRRTIIKSHVKSHAGARIAPAIVFYLCEARGARERRRFAALRRRITSLGSEMNRARDAREGFSSLIPRYVTTIVFQFRYPPTGRKHFYSGDWPARCASASAVTIVASGERARKTAVSGLAALRV